MRVCVAALLTAAALLLGGCTGETGGTNPPVTPVNYVVSPQGDPLVVTAGQRVMFTAAREGAAASAAESLIWSVEGDIGSINTTTGQFDATKVASSASPQVGRIRVRTSEGSGTIPVRVTVSPDALSQLEILYPANVNLANCAPGQTVQFNALGSDMFGNRSVGARLYVTPAWSCDPEIGAIDSRGRFTALAGTQTTAASGSITATTPGLGGMVTASVGLTVNFPAQVSVAPTALSFGDSTTSLSFDITNLGSVPLTWTATESIPWLSLSATSGSAPATVDVQVNRTGLAAGSNYTGIVTVRGSDGRTAELTVTMQVTAIDVIVSSVGGGTE